MFWFDTKLFEVYGLSNAGVVLGLFDKHDTY